jgi:putative membrane protein
LVFRTNTAYNRFWEGRKIWEKVLSTSRDLARFTMVFSDAMPQTTVERVLHLMCVFPVVLQEHVQGFEQRSFLREHLSDTEIEAINSVTNKPYFIACKLANEIANIEESLKFTARERQTMLKYVDDLSGCIGACERIVQTPVPLSYARHTSRFLTLFCFTAPIALVQEMGASVIPFVTLMSWSLFGIQEIGMMIEDPFQVLYIQYIHAYYYKSNTANFT